MERDVASGFLLYLGIFVILRNMIDIAVFFFLYGLHGIIRWKSHLIDVIVLVGGVVEDRVKPCCHCFNPLTNKWHYMSPVIDSRLNFGLARLQGCLFAVGGSTVGEKMTMLSSVERFHPKFNSWEKHAPLGQGKKGAKGIVGACKLQVNIYRNGKQKRRQKD